MHSVLLDILVIAVLAALAYYAPFPAPFKVIAYAVIFVIAILMLLPLVGVPV